MCEKILLTGATSQICKEFKTLVLSKDLQYQFIEIRSRDVDLSELRAIDDIAEVLISCDRIVLAHGIIGTSRFNDLPEKEIIESVKVNLLSFVRIVEIALKGNPRSRIVVLGSESGIKGSYDLSYALSKAALHKYIEERRISFSTQQLVCVAPSMVVDAGMTMRRHDQQNVRKSIRANPKQRGLTCKEVAQMIYFLLFVDQGYTSNVVIPINGGKFARMA